MLDVQNMSIYFLSDASNNFILNEAKTISGFLNNVNNLKYFGQRNKIDSGFLIPQFKLILIIFTISFKIYIQVELTKNYNQSK